MIFFASAALAAPLLFGAAPSPGTAEKLRDDALSSSRAAEWVRSLTDTAGPRLAGSKGDSLAVAWAVQQMKALGFSHVHTEKVIAPHWERGEEFGELVAPVPVPLHLTALGRSVATPAVGLEGDVVEFPSLEALRDSPPTSVQGKIAFINFPMARSQDGQGYVEAVGARGAGSSEASKHGAMGYLMRSVSTANTRLPHTGNQGDTPGGVTPIPAAAVAVPDAELLHRLLAAGKHVRVHYRLGCKMLPDVETANVVGDVPGRERPQDIVLVGAHLDSWDLAMGALDDGAGVGASLEVGRRLLAAAPHPRRTVRVVLFANEENGLAGAFAYAAAHKAELDHHVLAMETDLGTGRVWDLSYLAGPGVDAPFASMGTLLKPLGIAAPHAGTDHGADLIPLRAAGVPVIELRQDATTYFDYHHSGDDTLDKVDPAALSQVVAATLSVAYSAAESTVDFGRIPEAARERPRH